MKLPPINGWTALVVVAALAGIIAMVYLKVELTTFALYATAVIGVVSQLSKLFPGDKDPPPPPPPPAGPTILPPPGGGLRRAAIAAVVAAGLALGGMIFGGAEAGCTPAQQQIALELAEDKVTCGLRNMRLPPAEVIKRCAIQESDVPRVFRIMEAGRSKADEEVAAARLASASSCGDGGLR